MLHPHAPSNDVLHIGTAFDRAHAAATVRDAAAPVKPLRDVDRGQPFIVDARPHEMCIRGTRVPGLEPGEVTVVVIAVDAGANTQRVGHIFAMQAHETVRLVDIVSPLKARARA